MEIQSQPASGGARVTLRLGPAGGRWPAFLAVAAGLLAASLLFTAPTAVAQAGRSEDRSHALGGSAEARESRERVLRLAREIRDRALERADYLNRAALVAGVSAAR
jgi:hypothetical protein